ncbi:MAG: hypothetical protein RR911_01550 [Oscillospiraceae bacterium]
MNKKIIIALVVVLLICPLLIFLISDFRTTQDLMKPPKLYGNNAEIQTAFEKSIKNSDEVLLKYPSEGDYRSAYVMYDVDLDGNDEALVFYYLKSDESVVHINILDTVNDEWVSVCDLTGYGSEVISISFMDMNNDGKSEVMICWSLYESNSSKVVTIHKTTNRGNKVNSLKTMANESYSYLKMVDLDGDGDTEMFISQLDSSKDTPTAYAKLLKMKKNDTISVVGEVTLDGSVSGYSSLKVETDASGNPTRIFIDANKGENQMITEVVYWNKSTSILEAPFIDKETLTNRLTLRTPGIASMDINDDGIIEIPMAVMNKDISSSDIGNTNEIRMGITKWCDAQGDQLVPKIYSLVNFNDLYIMAIPNEYSESVIAYNNLKQRKVTVFDKTSKGEKGNELYSIITVAVGEWSKHPTKEYSILKRNDSLVYAYNITSSGLAKGITPEKLASNLKIIKQGG